MWNDEFAEVHNWVALGELEPALRKIESITQATKSRLGQELLSGSKLLLGRFHIISRDRLRGRTSTQESQRDFSALLSDALDYSNLLERAIKDAPPPARGPRVQKCRLKAVPAGHHNQSLEALLNDNPLRKIAWLERAVLVSRSICKLETPRSVGTGFIAGRGFLVTNNHVLETKTDARKTVAIFNFQEDHSGLPLATITHSLDPDQLFLTSASLDCTVVALNASRSEIDRWGILSVRNGPEVEDGSLVSVIQHPDGGYKRIALLGDVHSTMDERIFYETSTMPGSSGAPVFDESWNVLALHQGAGTWSPDDKRYTNNVGIRFSAILQDSKFNLALQ